MCQFKVGDTVQLNLHGKTTFTDHLIGGTAQVTSVQFRKGTEDLVLLNTVLRRTPYGGSNYSSSYLELVPILFEL